MSIRLYYGQSSLTLRRKVLLSFDLINGIQCQISVKCADCVFLFNLHLTSVFIIEARLSSQNTHRVWSFNRDTFCAVSRVCKLTQEVTTIVVVPSLSSRPRTREVRQKADTHTKRPEIRFHDRRLSDHDDDVAVVCAHKQEGWRPSWMWIVNKSGSNHRNSGDISIVHCWAVERVVQIMSILLMRPIMSVCGLDYLSEIIRIAPNRNIQIHHTACVVHM